MREKFQAKLLVDNKPIEMIPFVEELLARVSVGAASALKGVEDVKRMEIHKNDNDMTIMINDKKIALSQFPIKVITSTLSGLILTLKGADDSKKFDISVETKS